MSIRHNLGSLTQIPPGEGRNFRIGARNVAVFHARDGSVFASDAYCPHRHGPLADGLLGAGTVVCPLHEWRFDLRTGDALRGECKLQVYPVALEADDVWIELPVVPGAEN
jgi:nitrite reductase (NADH) small subunit